MRKVIAILCILGIAAIVLYKLTIALFRDKITALCEYDKIAMPDFIDQVQTGDIIYFMQRLNPRFVQYILLGILYGTLYIHAGMVVKARDGTPYIIHLQMINGKTYKRLSPNLNKNSGGIYIEKLEDCVKFYSNRFKSIFAWYRVKPESRHRFVISKIIASAFSLKNIPYMSMTDALYYFWRRITHKKDQTYRRNKIQCNIVIGCILENLGIFPRSEDIYMSYMPDVMENLLEMCGAYKTMIPIKIV